MNNFNQSSTGLNITVSAFRDTDLSRFYFESEEQAIIMDFLAISLKTDLDYQ